MSVAYLDALRAELVGAGITGRRSDRILTEITDHLACDPAAQLGSPREIARQFANELGTLHARRAAGRSFAALAIAGLLFGAAFAGSPPAAFGAARGGAAAGTAGPGGGDPGAPGRPRRRPGHDGQPQGDRARLW